MADITKETNTLSIVAEFTDGDDRTITLPNPKDNISAAEINSLSAYCNDNDVLIGDKAGADFHRFKSATVRSVATTFLDLKD